MQKLTYFNVPSIIYNWDEYKRACNIDIYGTKNKLEKEYHILFFHTNSKIHKLFNNSKLETILQICKYSALNQDCFLILHPYDRFREIYL